MSQLEREIKILNVNVNEVKKTLEKNKIKCKFKYIQDVYTYDLPKIDDLYVKYVKDLIKYNDKRKITKLLSEITPCFDKKDRKTINKVLKVDNILDYVNSEEDYKLLLNDDIKNIIVKAKDNFSKWVRLRQTGDETTITIKRIVDSSGEYALDNVEELELDIKDIETGKELLSDLGYFFARHQRKLRLAYDYKKTEIVIDKWPLIDPYIEIEGPSQKAIDEAVVMLGFDPKDTIIMNTDDVYKKYGIDIYSEEYKDLDFTKKELKEVNEYMK